MASCPICRRPVPDDGPGASLRPFCSERCKKIDLAAWLDGAYRISRPLQEEDLDAGPPGPVRPGDDPGPDAN
jgi:endogenous inhibitor of DNA gyrase (YacG/DUF329 family)